MTAIIRCGSGGNTAPLGRGTDESLWCDGCRHIPDRVWEKEIVGDSPEKIARSLKVDLDTLIATADESQAA